jgi:hypothetical protein
LAPGHGGQFDAAIASATFGACDIGFPHAEKLPRVLSYILHIKIKTGRGDSYIGFIDGLRPSLFESGPTCDVCPDDIASGQPNRWPEPSAWPNRP